MSKFYAQINNGIVVTINKTETELIGDNIVEIQEQDLSLLGATYHKETGVFEKRLSSPIIDQQKAALDAIINGLVDTATQTADANDAVMNALIDMQVQIDAIKTKVGA